MLGAREDAPLGRMSLDADTKAEVEGKGSGKAEGWPARTVFDASPGSPSSCRPTTPSRAPLPWRSFSRTQRGPSARPSTSSPTRAESLGAASSARPRHGSESATASEPRIFATAQTILENTEGGGEAQDPPAAHGRRPRAQARSHPHRLSLPALPSGPRRGDPRGSLPRNRRRFPKRHLAAAGTQG